SAEGLHRIGVHGVADFLGIRRDGVVVRAAERKRGNVAVARRKIFYLAAIRVDDEQVRAAPGLPGSPVPVKQGCVAARGDFALLFGVQASLVAVVVRAIGKDFAGEDDFLSVGREQEAAGLGGEIGDLPGVGAVGVHGPDLGGAVAIGDEGDALGIGRPLRALVGGALGGDLAGRPRANAWGYGPRANAWGYRNDVDLLGLGVLFEVDGLDGEGDGFAVGRKLRFADSSDFEESLDV